MRAGTSDGRSDGASAVLQAMRPCDFARLRDIVHAQSGITIAEGRRSMMTSRLNKRLRELGIGTYQAYIARALADPVELQELIDRITTNETYCYRTPRIWDHFREILVPGFVEKGLRRPMRIWSAAASTGEEAQTIGVILEEVRQKTPAFDYSILGTDISARVLKVATEGRYFGRSVARFRDAQPDLFDRHMRGSETEGWRAAPEIRARIRYQRHNLMKPLVKIAPFDVIFLRNVLIYFTAQDQETVLRHARAQLHGGGTLFIGESESLKHLVTEFEQIAPIVYRAADPAPGLAP